jgi:LPXTG-motif cell wall-anchored protein
VPERPVIPATPTPHRVTTPAKPTPHTVASEATLPKTGTPSTLIVAFGLSGLAMGAALLLLGRRPRGRRAT